MNEARGCQISQLLLIQQAIVDRVGKNRYAYLHRQEEPDGEFEEEEASQGEEEHGSQELLPSLPQASRRRDVRVVMAKGRTAQQRKFSAASNACIKVAESWPAFGRCMKSHLGGRKRRKKGGRRKGRR